MGCSSTCNIRWVLQTAHIPIYYHMFINNQFCVYPMISKTTNIGFDGTGLHCGISHYYEAELDDGSTKIHLSKVMPLSFLMRYFYRCFIERKSRLIVIIKPIINVKRILKNLLMNHRVNIFFI
jgi:hypothetical protein